jgi:hypothetical protein
MDSKKQLQNAQSLTNDSLDSDSIVTQERPWHKPKQFSLSVSTDEGIQTEVSDLQSPNADFPIKESFEPVWNVTTERFGEPEKQYSLSVSTDEGIQTQISELQRAKALTQNEPWNCSISGRGEASQDRSNRNNILQSQAIPKNVLGELFD